MKKGKIIFFTLLLFATCAVFFSFVKVNKKLSAWEAFEPVKKKFDAIARVATGFEAGYFGLTSGQGSLIFKVPSITVEYSLVPEAYDLVSVITSGDTLVFTLIPSPAGTRTRQTTSVFDIQSPALNQAGEIAEFSCRAKGLLFSGKSRVNTRFTPLPIGGEKLQ